MNLDKLIKLVKLAVGNPYEHEANAAARKVCQMIADNNYQLTETPIPPKVRVTSNPTGSSHDWVRKKYTEPSRPANPFSERSDFNDFMKDFMGRGFRSTKAQEDFYKRYTEGSWDTSEREPIKSRKVACNKCQYEFTISIDIDPKTYVCSICKGNNL